MKKRLKDFVNVRSKTIKNDFSDDILYVDISSVNPDIGIIKKDLIKFNEAPSRAKKHVSHNDIIISNVRTYLKSIALIQNPEHNLIVSTGFSVLAPKRKFNPLFLNFLLKNDFFHHEVMKKSKGVSYPAINTGELLDIECLADFENQDKIVEFLDEKCSKIDTDIMLLEKKSILLDEYKNALIYETVSKGLDKNAEMKDSGVEWIGKIPCHWSIRRVCDSFNGLKKITTPGRTDVLSLTLNGVIEKDIENLKGLNPESYDTYQIFKKDNLVFKLIDLENYKTSRVGRVFKDGIMSSAYIRLEGKKNTNISYQYYQFFDLYLRGIFNSIGSNGVRSTLNRSDLLKIPSIIPPKEEQKEIADFLDVELTNIASKIELINKKIELLKEYKQSLIYEAVTGQLEIE